MAILRPPKGATKSKKVKGRGNGSGIGGTCGRGHNGQNSRSGGGTRPGFEGGQMPLYRRLARRGFSNNPFKKEYTVINLDDIQKKYADGDTVDIVTLKEKRIVKGKKPLVKLLANGEISVKVTISVDKVSQAARVKCEAAGCTINEKQVEEDNGK